MTRYNNEAVNGIPVDAMPVRPGWGRLLTSLATILLVAGAGFFVTGWVAKRWARQVAVG